MTVTQPAPSSSSDDTPLSPEQERLVARIRRMSQLSALVMVLGASVVFSVIGYRLFAAPQSAGAFADVTATLPRGAKVVATEVAGDFIVVRVELNGAIEVRTFAIETLKPAGRLRFASEP